MSLLQESVDALTAAAGWKKASPGADGVFRFRLEGDLDMEFFSPDGRTGILRADLGPLPAAEQDADDLLRKCASRMVAASRSRRTVLSVDEGRFSLHLVVPLAESVASMPGYAKDFLNDLAWWKRQVQGVGASAFSSSPVCKPGIWGADALSWWRFALDGFCTRFRSASGFLPGVCRPRGIFPSVHALCGR